MIRSVSGAAGVNVLGYLREAKGIGEAGRLYARALEAAGLPVRTGAIEAGFSPREDGDHGGLEELGASAEHPTNLVCLNAPELQRALADGARLPRAERTIGVWAWEVAPAPAEWAEAAEPLDEIWTYSGYVAAILGRVAPVPVVVVPLPVVEPDPPPRPDARTAEGFTFLFMFDFHSMLRRKNPLGLIDAFGRAFEPGAGPRLVVKTFNGEHRPEDLARVREAAAPRPDVEVVDEYVSREARDALLAGCDCYVSLHRAEGFGLTLAEAMALERPVIATGFSGNTDFMTPANSYPVGWEPVPVGPDCEVYPAEAWWSEPDLDHAAAQMRRVHERPEEATAKARRARQDVRARLSPEAVGAIARTRLELLAERRRREGWTRRLLRGR